MALHIPCFAVFLLFCSYISLCNIVASSKIQCSVQGAPVHIASSLDKLCGPRGRRRFSSTSVRSHFLAALPPSIITVILLVFTFLFFQLTEQSNSPMQQVKKNKSFESASNFRVCTIHTVEQDPDFWSCSIHDIQIFLKQLQQTQWSCIKHNIERHNISTWDLKHTSLVAGAVLFPHVDCGQQVGSLVVVCECVIAARKGFSAFVPQSFFTIAGASWIW